MTIDQSRRAGRMALLAGGIAGVLLHRVVIDLVIRVVAIPSDPSPSCTQECAALNDAGLMLLDMALVGFVLVVLSVVALVFGGVMLLVGHTLRHHPTLSRTRCVLFGVGGCLNTMVASIVVAVGVFWHS